MKTIILVALALAVGTSYAREAKKKPEPQASKPQPVVNRGAMKNCPHDTPEQRERGPSLEL
jgi:hypothetical protein